MTSSFRSLTGSQRELDNLLVSGYPTATDIAAIVRRLAPLVLGALDDVEHPLAKAVAALQQTIKHHQDLRPTKPSGRGSHTTNLPKIPSTGPFGPDFDLNRLYFSPMPGTGRQPFPIQWQAQLLLLVTAQAEPQKVALALSLSEAEVIDASKVAGACCTGEWAPLQRCRLLRDALSVLDQPEAEVTFDPGASVLEQGGKRVKLSSQEAKMAGLFLKEVGKPISHSALKIAGVNYPSRVKVSLLAKCKWAEIPFNIASAPKTYTYLP